MEAVRAGARLPVDCPETMAFEQWDGSEEKARWVRMLGALN